MPTYPFQPVPDTASIELIYEINGGKAENVFHVKKDTPFTAIDLVAAAGIFNTWWNAYLKPQQSNDVTLSKIVCKALDTDSSPAIEFTSGLPDTGAINDVAAPGNVTLAVKWSSGLAGRSYRGRTFHIGLCVTQLMRDHVGTTLQEALHDAYVALLDAVSGGDLTLVVVSRFHNNARRTTAVTTPITGVSVESTLDSQRRRLSGRGE